ncbi:transketolase [Isoptericola sp. b441]|uniref:Transketolase n=1 Tax=Actinotalea lenta TaxID=3064654 RepID=A0ABT9DD51_9CELL|nr:transketolase [Isoptericola sp. b441]MDO8108501.1 transketolase [Isoptericola sp. b441]
MVVIDSQDLARAARVSAVRATHRGKSSHIGSCLSVIDILAVLYSGVARVRPEAPEDPARDIVILSKGHAAAGLYSVLAHSGFFPLEWLADFSLDGSRLGGHVTSTAVPGVELSTGSLGHGLPFGVGLALAAKRTGAPRKVFVVMSDGECDEGTTWESALLAAHHGLDNLVVAVDRNHLQSLADTEQTLRLEPFAEKWSAFGWEVLTVDGHDHDGLRSALDTPRESASGEQRPRVVICETVKGKGVSFMENQVLWHYRSPDDKALATALSELLPGAEDR